MKTPSLKRSRRRRWHRVLWLLLVGVLVWAAVDLFAPRTSDLRAFDPSEVARLETAMWRAYYDRRPVSLFFQLSELLRTQYHFPWLRSQVGAFHAAKAAFVFKRGRNRAEYERALPNLVSFYTLVEGISSTRFDVERAARLELEWWIVHRQTKATAPEPLSKALAELEACIYRVPPERLTEHAQARAKAMLHRDEEEVRGGVSEQQWEEIHRLLQRSWTSLWDAVHAPTTASSP